MKIVKGKMKFLFVLIILFSTAVAIFNVGQPFVASTLLDHAIHGENHFIFNDIIILLLVTIAILLFELLRKLSISKYKKKITDILRSRLLCAILSKSYTSFNESNIQQYISIFNNEANEIVNQYYILFIDIIFSVFSIAIYSTSLLSLNYILAIVVIVTNIVPMLVPGFFRNSLCKKKEKSLNYIQKYNVKLGDAISGFGIIKTLLAKKRIEEVTEEYNLQASEMNKKYENVMSVCEIITALFSYTNYLGIVLIGVYLISTDKLTAGGLLAAVSVSELLVGPVTNIAYQINDFMAVSSVKKKVFNDILVNEKKDRGEEIILNEFNEIRIKNLSFEYDDKSALSNININFCKGKNYLIYGQNGCGKTTLLKIISKLYDNYVGEVLINGVELKNISEKNFYSCVGFVFQKSYMFNDTLQNNITLFDTSYNSESIERVIDFVKLDRIREDILCGREFGDSEHNISGGEEQKINLARSLIKGKKWLFLDEATSAFDSQSNFEVIKRLLMDSNVTIINIEHKVSKKTIKYYDEIIIMNNGKIDRIITKKSEIERFADEL